MDGLDGSRTAWKVNDHGLASHSATSSNFLVSIYCQSLLGLGKKPVWHVKLSDFDPHKMSIYPNTYPTLLYYNYVDDTGRRETIFLTVIVSF